jgi:hypothetical protein
MIGAPPFPVRPTELDAAFLSSALGAAIVDFEATPVGADRGMLGDLVLVRPIYATGASGPRSVVAKFAADREGSLASALRSGSHERELRFYDELAPATPVRVPAFHGAWYDPASARFLLLQEAIDVDPTVDQILGIDIERAALVMVEMARLHATWWHDPLLSTRDWLPRLDAPTRRHNLTTIAASGWAPLCGLVGDAIGDDDRRIGADLPARIDAALVRLAALPSTLLHSDLRADNLLFAPDGDAVVLVDWQGAGVGPPSWDLAYFLTQSLTVEDRRAHEGELMACYLSELRATTGVEADVGTVLRGFGDAMTFGLVVACSLPLVSNPNEPRVRRLATAMATRAIEGIRDHGSPWSTT